MGKKCNKCKRRKQDKFFNRGFDGIVKNVCKTCSIKKNEKTGHTKTYLFKDEISGLVKIGVSKDVKRRFYQLNTKERKLIIMGYLDSNIEHRLHRENHSKRVVGEWFKLTDSEIKKLISEEGFKK